MKKYTQIIIVAVVIALASFYGGMRYGKHSGGVAAAGGFSANARGERMGQGGGFGGGAGGAIRQGGMIGGITVGEIMVRDDKSITVALRDGGSKIVFFSSSTKIVKSVAGSPDDLATGLQITATGAANSDGSITSDSIQIRPDAPSSTRP